MNIDKFMARGSSGICFAISLILIDTISRSEVPMFPAMIATAGMFMAFALWE